MHLPQFTALGGQDLKNEVRKASHSPEVTRFYYLRISHLVH